MTHDAPLRRPVELTTLSATNLNLLVPLLALLEERSISAAAARIGAGHTAMVHALSRLRSMHGDELLVGYGPEREVTPYAVALLVPLQDVLQQAARVLNVSTSAVARTRDS